MSGKVLSNTADAIEVRRGNEYAAINAPSSSTSSGTPTPTSSGTLSPFSVNVDVCYAVLSVDRFRDAS